jgi:hypothetical protein
MATVTAAKARPERDRLGDVLQQEAHHHHHDRREEDETGEEDAADPGRAEQHLQGVAPEALRVHPVEQPAATPGQQQPGDDPQHDEDDDRESQRAQQHPPKGRVRALLDGLG